MSEANHLELLVIDDDDRFRKTLVKAFRRRGFHTEEASNAEEGWQLAQRRDFDVAVVDMVMPDGTGLELIEKFKSNQVECEVILLTGQASVETAVTAMKLGAYDYLTKPFPLAELEKLVEKASRERRLRKQNRQLKRLLDRSRPRARMLGNSPAMQEVFRLIERAGPSDKPILIQGESGTGKELVAWSLHENSPRAENLMVVINCAALPETLLESELFGHERGAFTGADVAKPGLMEAADGGTLFIDEIGEMPPAVQAKLLRVLEDGSLRRVGSIKERRVDVRLLAATNRDLEKMVEFGRFREDLFYRINVMSLELPPLRERQEDVVLLCEHFLGEGWSIEEDAMKLLRNYHWPGNVRQLINVIERAKILADEGTIRVRDLPRQIVAGTSAPSPHHTREESDELARMERQKVIEVLRREAGNKLRAAKVLGIERRKLYRLLEKHAITPADITGRPP